MSQVQIPADIDTAFEIDNLSMFLSTFLPYRLSIWIQMSYPFPKRILKAGRYGKNYR